MLRTLHAVLVGILWLGVAHGQSLDELHRDAALAHERGDYARAEALDREALQRYKQQPGDRAKRLASVQRLAVVCEYRGAFAEAETLYREALDEAAAIDGKNTLRYAVALTDLGRLYLKTGEHDRAEARLFEAQELLAKVPGPAGRAHAELLGSLGRLFWDKDKFERAEKHYLEAIAIARKTAAREEYVYDHLLEPLASLYRWGKRFKEAEPLYREAIDTLRKAVGEDHPRFAAALHNLGELHEDQGENDKAEELFLRSLAIKTKWLGERHPAAVVTRRHLAGIAEKRGDFARAEALLRQALEVTREVLDLNLAAGSERQQLGLVKEFRDVLDLYVSLVVQAGLPAEAAYREVLVWKGAVFARQYRLRQERFHPEFANELRQLRAIAFELAQVVRDGATTRAPEEWRRRLDDLTQRKDTLEAKVSSRVPAVRARPTPAQVQDALPDGAVLVDLLEFKQYLPDPMNKGQWKEDWRVGAFVVPRRGPLVLLDVGNQKELSSALLHWRTILTGPDREKPPGADPAIRLRQLIWEPLLPHIRDAQQVLISPDGVLARCPFAALPGSQPDRYLIEETPLAVVPVAQLLPDLGLREREPNRAASLLLVGDVDFGAAPNAPAPAAPAGDRHVAFHGSKPMTFGPLPGTGRECGAVAEVFRKAVVGGSIDRLTAAEATEDAFRTRVLGHRYMHLATHGFFSPAKRTEIVGKGVSIPTVREIRVPAGTGAFGIPKFNRITIPTMKRVDWPVNVEARLEERLAAGHVGLLSGVALAGANQGPRRDPDGKSQGDDGILTALEVTDLDLRGAELVVLSACETGLGESAGGEGLLGLQRAFQVCGARSTIASLWKVDDTATSMLMERFYNNLWASRMGKLPALREAQLAVLRGEGIAAGGVRGIGEVVAETSGTERKRVSPRYWAAWVLSGDPGELTELPLPQPSTDSPPEPTGGEQRHTGVGQEVIWAAAAVAVLLAGALLWWWRRA